MSARRSHQPFVMTRWMAVLACSLVACATNVESEERVGHARQAIVNGTKSTSADDGVVYVKFTISASDSIGCTGTFIAPNLVLTAAHCLQSVERLDENGCDIFVADRPATQFTIALGANATFMSPADAKGKHIYVPKSQKQCGEDIAVLELERDVPNAKIAALRFTALTEGEPLRSVGYGVDGAGKNLSTRMARETKLLAVGPTTISFEAKTGETFSIPTPAGDLVTGESTCRGDSGGPLFDADGKLVAVSSRGPRGTPQDTKAEPNTGHGPLGCIDMAELHTGLHANEAFVRAAAAKGGHPLLASAVKDEDGLTQESTEPVSDDEDEEAKPAKKKRTTPTASAPAEASSCQSAPGGTGGSAGWLIIAVAALITARGGARGREESSEC